MNINVNKQLLIIGAGAMGGALLDAWLKGGVQASHITVIETQEARAVYVKSLGVNVIASLETLAHMPECIVLAVKPQSMDELLPLLYLKCGTKPLYLSIAAGKTLDYYQRYLGDAAIVRAMPNTPAMIGQGMTVLCANEKISNTQKKLATELMQAAGKVEWLKEETLMNAVTAISGSGPAYVFYFLESLIAAGIAQGLDAQISKMLAVQTVLGAAALAGESSEELGQLRANVTSKGGTTEAALNVLMKDKQFEKLIAQAVDAAVKRGAELG